MNHLIFYAIAIVIRMNLTLGHTALDILILLMRTRGINNLKKYITNSTAIKFKFIIKYFVN